MPFLTRPHFEDRQIVQYSDESISLSGTSYIAATVLGLSGSTTGETAVTINTLTGYLNGQRLSGLVVEPARLRLSGTTGTTTQNVTGFVLQSIDPYGSVEWAPLSGVSWSVSACTSPLYVSTIEACPNPTDPIYITAGNVQFGASPSLIADITNTRLGIGTGSPSESLHITDGDILVENGTGKLYSDLTRAVGPFLGISGGTGDLVQIGVQIPGAEGMSIGSRGSTEPSLSGYGKQSDGFIYSSAAQNGLNILSQDGVGTDDYIRFYAGKDATSAADMFISGMSSNSSYIGMGTETPTEKLHIVGGKVKIEHDNNGDAGLAILNLNNGSNARSLITMSSAGEGIQSNGILVHAGTGYTGGGTWTGSYIPNSFNIVTAGGNTSNRAHINIGTRRDDGEIRFFGGGNTFDTSTLLGLFGTTGLTITDMVNTDTLKVRNGATLGHVLTSDASGNATWQYNSTGFSGNTSGTCITDLYVSNIYGCSPITIHDNIQSFGSQATGTTTFAFGSKAKAFGDYSFALGFEPLASGDNSHAQGYRTIASGPSSHAQGNQAYATGNTSHAEGASTRAYGDYSHAEGFGTTASGSNSHAQNRAYLAGGTDSHAEGFETESTGNQSHAEGSGSVASGNQSHAQGLSTQATGTTAHSEGQGSQAFGDWSHAGGYNSRAYGIASYAQGANAYAYGDGSNAQGGNVIAYSLYSFAGGLSSTSSGETSFVYSKASELSGNNSAILGGSNMSGTSDDTVYVPNLTVRGDHILHSDSTSEVSELPSNYEDIIKGSYTNFNWDGVTTHSLSNNNPSGYTSVVLGNLDNYPTDNTFGFVSYFNSGHTRASFSGPVGDDFYRNKLVVKGSSGSGGMVINPHGGTASASLWFEMDSTSVMKLKGDGAGKARLGIAMSEDGTEDATANLQIGGTGTTGTFKYIDGNEQNGYVLTSDADGNASWQVSSVSGGTSGDATIDPYECAGHYGTIDITWDVSGTSTNYDVTLTGDTTLNLTNVRNGDYGTIIVHQDIVGSRVLSFGTINGGSATHFVVNGGGGSPTLTTTINAVDLLSFTFNGSSCPDGDNHAFWTVGNDYT